MTGQHPARQLGARLTALAITTTDAQLSVLALVLPHLDADGLVQVLAWLGHPERIALLPLGGTTFLARYDELRALTRALLAETLAEEVAL